MARNKKAKEMTALEIESEILKQIELNDLDDIGEIVGVCGSAISKWKGDQKDHEIQPTAIGLKVVPQDQVFVDIDHLETVFDLASKGLNAEKNRILEQ